ncbi:hypothetical protein BDBG_17936, partial [Blastomyces gilchristii SLH14081]
TDIFIFIYIKSSCVDRSAFTDNSELNVKLLIKNLKNMIIKKLLILYITESLIYLSTLSVSFSVTLSQSSTLISVSDSLTSATFILMISTLTTSTLTTSALSVSATSAIIISSLCFKKILHRLSESCFLRIIPLLNSVKSMKNICVFRNENMNIILFYTCEYETHIPFALMPEIILIKDNNTAETIFFYSQASSIIFSLFSAEKVV